MVANANVDVTPPGTVAADGVLVWPEVTYSGEAPFLLPHVKLRARETNGTDHTLVDAGGSPSGYSTSGGRVVWFMGGAMDTRVYMADLKSGHTEAISAASPVPGVEEAIDPVISGNLVAWIGVPSDTPNSAEPYSLVVYDIRTGARATLLTSDKNLYAPAIVGEDAIAYLRASEEGLDLFLVRIR